MTAQFSEEKDRRVFALRAEGLSWATIGERLSITGRAAQNAFKRARVAALKRAASALPLPEAPPQQPAPLPRSKARP